VVEVKKKFLPLEVIFLDGTGIYKYGRKISNFVKNTVSLVPMIGVKGKSISRLRVCGFLIYTV